MEQQSGSDGNLVDDRALQREYEDSPAYLRDVLKCVVEIGASLRLQMDTDMAVEKRERWVEHLISNDNPSGSRERREASSRVCC